MTSLSNLFALAHYSLLNNRIANDLFANASDDRVDYEIYKIADDNRGILYTQLKIAVQTYISENNITEYSESDWVRKIPAQPDWSAKGVTAQQCMRFFDRLHIIEKSNKLVSDCAKSILVPTIPPPVLEMNLVRTNIVVTGIDDGTFTCAVVE
jgi:hypothetical protein